MDSFLVKLRIDTGSRPKLVFIQPFCFEMFHKNPFLILDAGTAPRVRIVGGEAAQAVPQDQSQDQHTLMDISTGEKLKII